MDDSDSSVNPDTLTAFQPADEMSGLIERVKVIGVGRTGIEAVKNLLADGRLGGLEFLCVDNDPKSLETIDPSRTLLLEGPSVADEGSTEDLAIWKAAALNVRKSIAEKFTDTYIAVVITDARCAVSLGASIVFASIAKELNILSLAIGLSQMDSENSDSHTTASVEPGTLVSALIRAVVNAADSTFFFGNEEAHQLRTQKIGGDREYSPVFEATRDAVVCITELLEWSMIDLMDMRAVLAGKGVARMGTGLAEGQNRVLAAADQALNDPHLGASTLIQARWFIAHIAGGPNLSFREIPTLAEYLYDQIDNDQADIVFGTAIEESLGDSLRVTIIAADLENITIH